MPSPSSPLPCSELSDYLLIGTAFWVALTVSHHGFSIHSRRHDYLNDPTPSRSHLRLYKRKMGEKVEVSGSFNNVLLVLQTGAKANYSNTFANKVSAVAIQTDSSDGFQSQDLISYLPYFWHWKNNLKKANEIRSGVAILCLRAGLSVFGSASWPTIPFPRGNRY